VVPGGGPTIGFAVVYRWRLYAGKEDQFLGAWETVTLALKQQRRALGSRLHRAEDGIWIAYAQWPDRESWQRSRDLGPLDGSVAERMREAIAESWPPILLDPVRDHLV
jgi:hypothetical protein